MQALLILGVLNDSGIQFLDDRLSTILVDILASDVSSEFSEMCLEVLHGQADDGIIFIFFSLQLESELITKIIIL